MRKNTASQIVAFQMNSATDGSAVTSGTPTVYYTIDGGTQATGGGTSTHEGNGQWSYAPAQAETNGNHVAFTMVLSGAITQTVNIWPVSFDPTDSVRAGLTALPNAAAGTAGGLPTDSTGKTSFNDIAATDVVSAGAITTLSGAVVNVDTVDTCTTNSDMRGTDSAALASVCTETRLSELDAATAGKMANQVDIIQTDTTTDIPSQISALNDISVADILTTQMTESYATDGTAPTLAQALFLIQQTIGDFSITGTTMTIYKVDGVTTAGTYTLDDGTNPTSLTRSS